MLGHLAVHRGIKAKPGQILIVPTAQSGIALVAAALLEPGDHAWIESPGYGGAYVAFKAAGAIVSAMPLDEQGMAIGSRKDAPRLIFVTPSHQYPTGRLMPIGRRLELLRYADAVGACIIEDDYDGEFHYEARPVAALQGLAPSPRIFYLGTFSKSTYADIRFGYVVVPEALIEIFELAQRHMGMLTSITMQDALAEFISAGAYLGHIRRMTRLYKGRRDRMLQALATEAGRPAYRRSAGRGHAIAGKVSRRQQRPEIGGAAARGRRRQPCRCRACCITRPASRACFSASPRGMRRRSTRPRACSAGSFARTRGRPFAAN